MYDTILVATDGSVTADRAVEHALELGGQRDVALHAIYVVDTSRLAEPALGSSEIETNDVEAWGQRALDDVVEKATAAGVDATTRCCHGKPHVEILDYAHEIDADVVVLGYQGHSHSDTDHIGSVTNRVVDDADRPVLVV